MRQQKSNRRAIPAAAHARVVENGRLVYFRRKADDAFWDGVWDRELNESTYRAAMAGKLSFLKRPVLKWLPREGKILEAGCGLGQFVVALRARGYDAEGVDFAASTIARVQRLVPHVPLRAGDVTRLDVPDGHYHGYISLGVIEHRRAGPQPFLTEAYRVLAPGGVALISVPHFHALRRAKARWGWYGEPDDVADGLEFYQYAFGRDELEQFVTQAGFRVEAALSYDGFKGIKDEVQGSRPVLRAMQKIPLFGWVFKRWLQHCALGHMLMLVCRKPDAAPASRKAA